MTIDELIYSRLRNYEPLAALLSTFEDLPAVFYQLAPDDRQKGWKGEKQYPRVVVDLDMQANEERKSSGTLLVSTLCDRTGTEPEALEPLVKECLKDLLIKPDGSFPYCFAWARTDPFEIEGITGGAAKRGVIGQEIRFDIVEYPSQETTDPDPVAAINAFLAEEYPEAVVVGLTHMGSFTEASAERPVIYCRLQGDDTESITNTVVWINARIAVHVICSDPEIRLKMAADIRNRITWAGEIIMLDGSPMRPNRVSLSNTADYLREGQLSGVYHYGVLRYRRVPHTVQKVHMELIPADQ